MSAWKQGPYQLGGEAPHPSQFGGEALHRQFQLRVKAPHQRQFEGEALHHQFEGEAHIIININLVGYGILGARPTSTSVWG